MLCVWKEKGTRFYCPTCDPQALRTVPIRSIRPCGHVKRIATIHRAEPSRLTPEPAKQWPGGGAGTELVKLLRRFWIPKCRRCLQRALEMDRRGPDWCEQNLETILGWLREGAEKRKLPFSQTIARLMVRRAIANARRAKPTPQPMQLSSQASVPSAATSAPVAAGVCFSSR